MRELLMLTAVLTILETPLLFADQIILKNGDQLTGSVITSDGHVLILKSEFEGEVKIQWDAILKINSSQPLYVTGKDGQVLVGDVKSIDGKFAVETANSGEVSLDKEVVQSVRSKEQQIAFEREVDQLRHPKLTDFWGGVVDTGLALSRGNTVTSTFNLTGKAARTTEKDKISLYVLSLYAKNKTGGRSETTASMVGGGSRYDFNISRKWFAFGQLDLLHDRFQRLDLRLAPNGGLGYHLINTKTSSLDLFAGGGLNKEFFTDNTSRASGEALLGEAFSRQFSKSTTLTESIQFFPNLKKSGELRYVFNLGLTTVLTRMLSWQMNFANLYQSNPLQGVKTSDGILTTGLRFSFGKPL